MSSNEAQSGTFTSAGGLAKPAFIKDIRQLTITRGHPHVAILKDCPRRICAQLAVDAICPCCAAAWTPPDSYIPGLNPIDGIDLSANKLTGVEEASS